MLLTDRVDSEGLPSCQFDASHQILLQSPHVNINVSSCISLRCLFNGTTAQGQAYSVHNQTWIQNDISFRNQCQSRPLKE